MNSNNKNTLLKIDSVMFYVSDLEKAANFYENALGLKRIWTHKEQKPFCVFALSGRGEFKKEALHTVIDYIEFLGLTLVSHDHPPFVAVSVRAGDEKGEVLRNKVAIKQCNDLVQKVIMLTERR